MKSVIEIQKERLEQLKKSKAKKADTEAMQESVNQLEEIEQRVKQTNSLINGSKSEMNEWKIGFSANGIRFNLTANSAQGLAKKVVASLIGEQTKTPALVIVQRQTHNFKNEKGFMKIVRLLRSCGCKIESLPDQLKLV